jgi:hypothetical protein
LHTIVCTQLSYTQLSVHTIGLHTIVHTHNCLHTIVIHTIVLHTIVVLPAKMSCTQVSCHENKSGILTTSVYHKEAAEPYVLPFKSDHPRHVFGNIIETALLRAIRYSSTSDIFNIEQRSIKLMLFYNGFVLHLYFFNTNLIHFSYPPRYIYT